MRRYTKDCLSLMIRINIRKYRKMRGFTLQELADLTGLSHGYVRDLECFSIDKTPLIETVGKFADALDIDIRLLFDSIDNDKLNINEKKKVNS